MKFKGYGIVWNGKKNKVLVNFKTTPEYETDNVEEIEILSNCNHVTSKSSEIETKEPAEKKITKKEIISALSEAGIEHDPREKKEVLLKLLEG